MKIKILAIAFFLFGQNATSQIPSSKIYFAKEFSKEITLYRAKAFLIEEVFGSSNKVVKFSIDPLAATKSGELTCLSYQCDDKNMEGLILGFYGNKWNKEGVIYQAYGFKNLPKGKAIEILNKLSVIIKEHSKFIDAFDDNNNVYFQHDDMTFLIYRDGTIKIRVFWENFDSEWEMISFTRTKKRFIKNLE